MNILDPIFYHTLFYDFRPVISPGTTSHNILSGWKIHREPNMTSMDNVDWDCRDFFGKAALEDRPVKICDMSMGLH